MRDLGRHKGNSAPNERNKQRYLYSLPDDRQLAVGAKEEQNGESMAPAAEDIACQICLFYSSYVI